MKQPLKGHAKVFFLAIVLQQSPGQLHCQAGVDKMDQGR